MIPKNELNADLEPLALDDNLLNEVNGGLKGTDGSTLSAAGNNILMDLRKIERIPDEDKNN